jgi:hypothetical protein
MARKPQPTHDWKKQKASSESATGASSESATGNGQKPGGKVPLREGVKPVGKVPLPSRSRVDGWGTAGGSIPNPPALPLAQPQEGAGPSAPPPPLSDDDIPRTVVREAALSAARESTPLVAKWRRAEAEASAWFWDRKYKLHADPVRPDVDSYSYAGTGTANPHAVTSIGNGTLNQLVRLVDPHRHRALRKTSRP